MPSGGHNLKPLAMAKREGNTGHRPLRDAVTLPPSALREPEWEQLISGESDEAKYVRGVAEELWRRVAPTLVRSVGLVGEQREALTDYCVTYARIVEGERAMSREGVVVKTQYGNTKNPWTTVLNQYRAHFRSLVHELGLSPQAATRLTRPESVDEDDPFD